VRISGITAVGDIQTGGCLPGQHFYYISIVSQFGHILTIILSMAIKNLEISEINRGMGRIYLSTASTFLWR
jgi:hypothetical protein